MMRRGSVILAAVLSLSFLLRLAIAFQPIDTLATKTLQDDSYYGFGIAKSIAAGGGMTYDGFDETNGFQPLWTLMISPAFMLLSGADPPITAVLLIAAAVDTLAVAALYLLGRDAFGKRAGLAGSALYGLNPFIAMQTMSGIEVPLAVLTVVLCFQLYHRTREDLSKGRAAMLGVFIGSAMLTRMDSVFVLAAIAAAELWRGRRNVPSTLRTLAIVGAVAATVVAPWLLRNILVFGSISQSSATANYYIYHGVTVPLAGYYGTEDIFSIIANNAYRAAGSIANQFGFIINSPLSAIPVMMIFAGLLAWAGSRKMPTVPVYAAAVFAFYILFMWVVQIRYFTATVALFSVLAAAGLHEFRPRLLLPAVAVILVFMAASGWVQWQAGYYNWASETMKETAWIGNNTQPDDVIAAFNSGMISYYSGRHTVNLDGVVNSEVLPWISNHSVAAYMLEKNVTYWVDTDPFNRAVAQKITDGEPYDIITDNKWSEALGDSTGKFRLLEQHHLMYRQLSGATEPVVFFRVKVA
ncbi:MAG: glycosyltransferase family 39 protein [Candidatus Aenigmatarchaeota archaeon]